MGRERLLYYALLMALFISVLFLLSWWNTIQQELIELPQTGASKCAVAAVAVSSDGINYTDELSLGSNFERFYLRFTDNANPAIPCAEMELALMAGSCSLEKCNYAEPINNWSIFSTDINGISRIDSTFYPLSKGDYSLKFKQADSLYAWSSPITIHVDAALELKQEVIDLSEYIVYEPGDLFFYNSKSYLQKGSRLAIPQSGTTIIEIESDTYWGDYLIRPWRIMKDNSALYWHPIPLAQEYTGANNTDDEQLRMMMISPLNVMKDKRISTFSEYIWAVGHKAYHRTNAVFSDREIDFNNLNNVTVYTAPKLQTPGVFFGKQQQPVPAIYFEPQAMHNDVSLDENTKPVLTGTHVLDRSWLLRVEKQRLPITVDNVIYDNVIRLDIFEGPGDFTKGEMPARESWYFAKDIGLVKLSMKFFSVSAFGGIKANYQYIDVCDKDPDCLSEEIMNPDIIMQLRKKQSAQQLQFEMVTPSSEICSETAGCISVLNTATDNGVYLKSVNESYTGFLETQDDRGLIQKTFWMDEGQSFIPITYFHGLEATSLYYRIRPYIAAESVAGEARVVKSLEWSKPVGLWIK